MIVCAPRQFPKDIRYGIVCAQLIAPRGAPQGGVSRVMSRLGGRLREAPQGEAIAAIPPEDSWTTGHERYLGAQLAAMLRRCQPSSYFIGFVNDPAAQVNGHKLLLFTHNWQELKARLLAAGWHEDNILIMPMPEGDYWAYWNNMRYFLTDDSGAVDAEGTCAGREYSGFLLNQCILVKKDGGLEYRKYTDSSLEGLSRGHQLYPFPSFATEALEANRRKIDRVRAYLSDARSREAYDLVIGGAPMERFRHYFRTTTESLQYFEYLHVKPDDCVLNAGVGSGFELPFFSVYMRNQGIVHCLDPDGFDHLSEYVRSFLNTNRPLFTEQRYVLCDRADGPCPQPILGDFSAYKPMSIDAFVDSIQPERVDIIKMDVEGMEELAVEAMAKTVGKYRPQLAIAVYHKVDHLWDLPLRLIELCGEDYTYHFNIYSPTHFEGIFYAIPKRR